MTTHDTDPQWPPPGAEGEEEKTSAPSPNDTAPDAAFVRELLSDIVRAPLPTEGVASTNGENAAAYEVAPHTPPRARVEGVSEPRVIVNTTQPMGLAPVVAPTAEMPSNDRGAPTLVRRRPVADYATDPSEHKRASRQRVTASVFGVGLLVVCAALWATVARTSKQEQTEAPTATASVAGPAAPSTSALLGTAPTAESTSSASPVVTTSAAAAPPATNAASSTASPMQAPMPASATPRATSPTRAPNRTEPAKPQAEPGRAAEPKAPPAVVPPPSTASKYIPEERF